MGRELTRFCENCVPGDPSEYYLRLALLVLATLVASAVTLLVANELLGRPATIARAAGLLLVVGPPVAAVYLSSDPGPFGTGERRVPCGSALSAALTRPLPGYALEGVERRCRDAGRTRVALVAGYGLATTAVAVGMVAYATVPRRHRAAA